MVVQEKYGVGLASEGKGQPSKMIRSGRNSDQAVTRARILLKLDEGSTAPPLAGLFNCRCFLISHDSPF